MRINRHEEDSKTIFGEAFDSSPNTDESHRVDSAIR